MDDVPLACPRGEDTHTMLLAYQQCIYLQASYRLRGAHNFRSRPKPASRGYEQRYQLATDIVSDQPAGKDNSLVNRC